MAFRASLLVTADAAQAKGVLRETASEVSKTTEATRASGTASTAAAAEIQRLVSARREEAAAAGRQQAAILQVVNAYGGVRAAAASAETSASVFTAEIDRQARGFHDLRMALDPVYRSSKQYEAAVETATNAVRIGAATQAEANRMMQVAEAQYLSLGTGMRQLGTASQAGTAQLGNLAAQFNDIGVMLAAGQSPLQLALQQGTQISQVLGPMGAGGAVRALGAAFLSLLNPMSLITIGTIAAGAALFSWLREAVPETIDLGEALEDAEKSVDALTAASRRLSVGALDELQEKYGQVTRQVRSMLEAQRALAQLDAVKALNQTQAAVAGSVGEAFGKVTTDWETFRRTFTNTTDLTYSLNKVLGLSIQQAEALYAAYRRLESADGVEEKVAAYRAMYDLVLQTYGGLEKLNDAQQRFVKSLIGAESAGRAFIALDMETPVARAADRARALADEISRAAAEIRGMGQSAEARLQDAKIRRDFAGDPVEMARRLGVASMERTQAPLRETAPAAELAALDAQAAAYGAVEAEIAAADEARRKLLSTSRSGARDFDQERQAVETLLAQERTRLAVLRETDPVRQQLLSVADRMTAATAAERTKLEGLVAARIRATDAARVQDMVDGLQKELDVMRELDPVQQEMIRLRDRLKGATDEERAAVELLIRAREEEAEANRTADYFADTAYDAFEGLILKGEDATDVVRDLTAALAEAAWKAALLGEGGLAGAFGTKESGGLFGMLAKAVVGGVAGAAGGALAGGISSPYSGYSTADVANQYASYGLGRTGAVALAGGGRVVGPGTGTSDSIPALLSNGEFVVNAAAANRHMALLEAINGGAGDFARAQATRPTLVPTPPSGGGGRGGHAVNVSTTIQVQGGPDLAAQLPAILDRRDEELKRDIGILIESPGSAIDGALTKRGAKRKDLV
ncbi:phage tail length tape measure family protein [Albimonas sp. CAU 1670]|uniref:phage tail length tape measure family protein n=1 Tax=Albimonas sp. CAU 1670 TaxID=3032599 RepID=UPI0023DA62F7|nr:phage tail length tape measure family protein [Albimonas sp. CAU 1670]MDF2232170.1 phage tail length tape measure family protein [Albimonas sp. CAU 1670]